MDARHVDPIRNLDGFRDFRLWWNLDSRDLRLVWTVRRWRRSGRSEAEFERWDGILHLALAI